MCMYTSNYTSDSDLATAFDQGVIINLDDVTLVDSLIRVRGRTPDLISFRLNPGIGKTDSETKSNVLGGPDAKFGVSPEHIVDGYRRAKAAGSTRFGMHMMTGSCVNVAAYWVRNQRGFLFHRLCRFAAVVVCILVWLMCSLQLQRETITVLLDTVAQVHRELGITFEFINVGGGLGIPYRPNEQAVNVELVADIMKSTVMERLAFHNLPFKPAVYMEQGRHLTGPFGWLVAKCHVVKESYGNRCVNFGWLSCMVMVSCNISV
jgi:diaminopimelate decarboxylase